MEYSSSELKKAAQALSERYRTGDTPYLRTPQDRQAYLLTRYPATKAALQRVFQEVRHLPFQTLLDIGAGPGTAWDAAQEFWPLEATCLEKDPEFIKIGSQRTPATRVRWITKPEFKPHDLVLFSYSWGEILDFSLLEKAWHAAQHLLIVVEPGTPKGYSHMLKAREYCIAQGATVFAPCPHSKKCPWENTKEWCHFGVRLERSTEHRLFKEGSLGYEDEKFSYVILSKQPHAANFSRLLKDPLRRKGHTLLTLCTKEGIEQKTITKKYPNYKQINKLKWGDKI